MPVFNFSKNKLNRTAKNRFTRNSNANKTARAAARNAAVNATRNKFRNMEMKGLMNHFGEARVAKGPNLRDRVRRALDPIKHMGVRAVKGGLEGVKKAFRLLE
jgi:hypothetical protein